MKGFYFNENLSLKLQQWQGTCGEYMYVQCSCGTNLHWRLLGTAELVDSQLQLQTGISQYHTLQGREEKVPCDYFGHDRGDAFSYANCLNTHN